MDPGRLALLVVALLSALNWAVHYYTQTVTYRLFPAVAAAAGAGPFVRYHQAYEARLPLSVYAPWSALTVATVVLLFVKPAGVDLAWVIAILVLNVSIAPISLFFAAPVHRAIDRDGNMTSGQAAALLQWNGVRLAVATVSLVTVTILSVQQLTLA